MYVFLRMKNLSGVASRVFCLTLFYLFYLVAHSYILIFYTENYANASTFDQLLAEAGVTLDAMSLLSSDDPLKQGSHSQYTQGTIGAYEPSLSHVLQEVTGPGECCTNLFWLHTFPMHGARKYGC